MELVYPLSGHQTGRMGKNKQAAATGMSNDERFISRAEAAKIAGCSVDTIDRRIAEGLLPAYRFGAKTIRVKLSDIENMFRRIPVERAA